MSTFVKSNKFFFVHSIMKKIESWNYNLTFFVKGKIVRSFLFINKNRLKNIFSKVLHSGSIWIEVEKMIFVGLLEFSNNNIYQNFSFKTFNSLSYLVFNIYLSELDFYIFSIVYKFSRKFIFINTISSFNEYKKKFLYSVFPLKFSLSILCFIEKKYNYDYFCLSSFFYIKSFKKLYYKRKFNYIRYLDFFLIGVFVSKFFILKLNHKISSFIKSNLFLFLEKTLIFSTFEKDINFLGYNIVFLRKNSYFSTFNSFHFLSKELLFNRLFFKSLFFLKILLNRFYQKLISFYVKYLNFLSNNLILLKNNKIWIYFFSLECLKNIRFSRHFFKSESCLYYNYFFVPFFAYFQKYNFMSSFYLFDRFFSDTKFIFFLPSFLKIFIFSDSFIKYLFNDFSIKFSLIFYSFRSLIIRSRFILRSFFINKRLLFPIFINKSPYYNIFFYYITKNDSFYLFRVFFSLFHVLNKLQNFGFLNSNSQHPIANVKYIFLEDLFLLQFFGSLSYFFFNWFFVSFNFLKTFFIIKLLKQC